MESEDMKPCPFCGKKVDLDDNDVLYPSGTVWKDDVDIGCRVYFGYDKLGESDGQCWGMHCPEPAGGCGAEIHGDSMAEALAKWNKRVGN